MSFALKAPMPVQGFFSFCTSLRPIELKAMGQLSCAMHLKEGEVIYSPGDPGDAIFIINRGVIEILPDPAMRGVSSTYLWRGDIFGDLETLMNAPRRNLVRTSERASLQRIMVKDFPELAQRVPSFFPFLSAHLANRLAATQAVALSKNRRLELSGNLANFDLVTIYQTIAGSLQTGELAISDDSGNPFASFFFEEGRPMSGQFQHLTGNEAFSQLFLSDPLIGTFSFASRTEPQGNGQANSIQKSESDMLITALQARDEFLAIKERFGDTSRKLQRQKLNFSWPDGADVHLRGLAEQIWQIAYTMPLPLSSLYAKCSVCEFKIYQVVEQLVEAKLFKLVSPDEAPASEELVIESSN
jgi:CRP-like cAMP-binding protein